MLGINNRTTIDTDTNDPSLTNVQNQIILAQVLNTLTSFNNHPAMAVLLPNTVTIDINI